MTDHNQGRMAAATAFVVAVVNVIATVTVPALVTAIAIAVSSPMALAVDDSLYYAIGGGAPITRPATSRDTTITIGANAGWGASNGVCSEFDPSLSVAHQLEGMQGSFQTIMSDVINAATGAVASLPALVIQRANPTLYDLMQNGILQGTKEFQLARVSCEDAVAKMGEVMDTGDWHVIAQGTRWGSEASGGSEILAAKSTVGTEAGNDGVIWAGGERRGGDNQPPIELVRDATRAGYNITLQRNPADVTGVLPLACDGSQICEEWTTPDAMADWVTQVVGESEIQICENCPPGRSKAGLGLGREVEREARQIEADLALLVAATDPPTVDELDALSGGPAMQVTRNVVEALREESPVTRSALQQRLASEMALARTMEKAMLARRALLAGRSEPNIEKFEKAQQALGTVVAELEQEMDNLLYEMEIRQRVSTNTAAILIGRGLARQSVPLSEPRPRATFKDGAVEQ